MYPSDGENAISASEEGTYAHLEAVTQAQLEAIATAVHAAIKASEENTYARIERVETTLLTEFHKCVSPAEMRARSHAAVLRAIDAGIESPSDRVARLEGNPPAA